MYWDTNPNFSRVSNAATARGGFDAYTEAKLAHKGKRSLLYTDFDADYKRQVSDSTKRGVGQRSSLNREREGVKANYVDCEEDAAREREQALQEARYVNLTFKKT
jgi:hypothetical protein